MRPRRQTVARRVPGLRTIVRRAGAAVDWRIDELRHEVAPRIEALHGDLEGAGAELAALRGAIDGLHADIEEVRRRMEALESELHRVTPQVASIEVRLEDAAERLDDLAPSELSSPDPAALEALRQARVEHARIRARLAAISHFEERLRVIEKRLHDAGT